MGPDDAEIDRLCSRAAEGDDSARGRLLSLYRSRLCGMVAARMDARLAVRLDPSDIVQETLAEAHRRLDDYLRDRPLPFYPWLRQLGLERLIDLHRRHVVAAKRAIGREDLGGLPLSDASLGELANRLAGSVSAPSARLRREESQKRLHTALERLPIRDREVLVMWHLEQMRPQEIAAVLDVSVSAVRMRHLRAVERLQALFSEDSN